MDKSHKWSLWLAFLCLIAAFPGFLMARFSINTFDEPYQIMNAQDWQNSVYSPLSGYLGYLYGAITGWKYLAFRKLLVFLIAFSVYLASWFALRHTTKKLLICAVSAFTVYFATIFKSDMLIYGWDHWSAVIVVVCLILSLSLTEKWAMSKITALGFFSGICILLRLPNICIIPICLVLIPLYGLKKRKLGEILLAETIYLVTAIFTCWLILSALYGSFSSYIQTFQNNPVGAHSAARILKPLSLSIIFTIRFVVIMLGGYFMIWIAVKKLKNGKLKTLLIGIVTVGFFILLYPLRRNVLGNVIDASIAFALTGILLLFMRGYKQKEQSLIVYSLTILLISSVVVAGSNWGFYKFLAWPCIPLLAGVVAINWTAPIKWYTLSFGTAMLAYSFFGYFRPTFDDQRYNTLRFPLKTGVLEGMYTNETRGKLIEEVNNKVEPFIKAGYEIIPIRYQNEYIWEYIYGKRNAYQRHQFDNWEAYNDSLYVDWVVKDSKNADNKRLILFMDKDTLNSNLMKSELLENFREVGRGSRFYLLVKE